MSETIERRQVDGEATRRAIDRIIEEHLHQRNRWTVTDDKQRHPGEWVTILSVYMGKLATETRAWKGGERLDQFKKRLTQLGAICASALEALEEE